MSNSNNQAYTFPSISQGIVHYTRYARYLEEENRRELWPETVDRTMTHMRNHLIQYNISPQDRIYSKLESGILGLEFLPSMRHMMTAGEALRRENVAAYNCAYSPINHPRAFDEIVYILMNGTGMGFSVERQEINQLPDIPKTLDYVKHTIQVRDSKRGWAEAIQELIEMLYKGQIPGLDTSKVRPAGARLIVFGGTASGPEPLIRLHQFICNSFLRAKGRKLNSLEVHDIVCNIGDVVISGGVRRSALLSLSNLSDERMRGAKSGDWRSLFPYRAGANNSTAYTERPEVGQFMTEFNALYHSYSGERGFSNRQALVRQCEKYGRDSNYNFGLNPCVRGNTQILTDQGNIPIIDLVGKTVNVWNGEEFAPVTPYSTGVNPLMRITLSDGSHLECTPKHRWCVHNQGFVHTVDLSIGDKLQTFDIPSNSDTEDRYVVSIEDMEINEETYCFTEPKTSRGTFNGIVTGQCGEIILRPNQFCNVSTSVAREGDTLETLIEKVKMSAIMGTYQSTLTKFNHIRDTWRQNSEEERLLGTSITGIMDCPLLNGVGTSRTDRNQVLEILKGVAIQTNKEWAAKLNIPQSAAVTTVKPEGTVSLLTDTSSGIHKRYAKQYVRRIQNSIHDPSTAFMASQGVPVEPYYAKENTVVFSIPIKAPDTCVTRNEGTAIEELENWLDFKTHWCMHNPSVTINVREEEWPAVGAWVWEHFDDLSGISLFPHDNGKYEQAPNEELEDDPFEDLSIMTPASLDWSLHKEFEDHTTGSQQIACLSGQCEL